MYPAFDEAAVAAAEGLMNTVGFSKHRSKREGKTSGKKVRSNLKQGKNMFTNQRQE